MKPFMKTCYKCKVKVKVGTVVKEGITMNCMICPKCNEKFFTFKVSALKKCVKHKASLLVCKHETLWICHDMEKIQEMLDDLEHKVYYGFSPNDLAVRMTKELIEYYFLHVEWCETAQEYINENRKVL